MEGLSVEQLDPSWRPWLKEEFTSPYMQKLSGFLDHQWQNNILIHPPKSEIFQALKLTKIDHVKVVIIGQDPYHGHDQAHGLSFSVKHGIKPPPSLVNIYKELYSDLRIDPPPHGYLQSWAKQGVLLLNAVLTVNHGQAGSHAKKGWETFTDRVISTLNEKRNSLVFILWGRYAQDKGAKIDRQRHLVIESPHPSPFSARNGFFGSKPFSRTNAYLESKGITPVDWRLT